MDELKYNVVYLLNDDKLDKLYCITFGPFTMFLEICMQIHSVVFALSQQINKQKVCENSIIPLRR